MSVSRRRFLRSGAVVSAALVLKPSTFIFGNNAIHSNSATSNTEIRTQSYSREMFEPHVGDTFRVRVGRQTVELKLVAVTDIKTTSGITTGRAARTECFSLRFDAVKPVPSATTVHTLNHSKLGNFDLFMVQSKNGAKFLQTAIVNQLL